MFSGRLCTTAIPSIVLALGCGITSAADTSFRISFGRDMLSLFSSAIHQSKLRPKAEAVHFQLSFLSKERTISFNDHFFAHPTLKFYLFLDNTKCFKFDFCNCVVELQLGRVRLKPVLAKSLITFSPKASTRSRSFSISGVTNLPVDIQTRSYCSPLKGGLIQLPSSIDDRCAGKSLGCPG